MSCGKELFTSHILFKLWIIVYLAAVPAFAQDAATALTEAEVDKVRQELVDAFKRRDTDAMLSLTTPDIVVTWQNGETSKGKEELRKFIDRMLSGPDSVVSEVEGDPSVEGRKVYSDHILSYGHMNDSFTLRATGQKLEFDSRYSAFLVRQEGRLLLAGLHLSVNVFDNPVMAAAAGLYKKFAFAGSFVCLIAGLFLGRMLYKQKKIRV